jgi:hypothetical protein
MPGFDADILASQLAQLGRDLVAEVDNLRDLELGAVKAEAGYQVCLELHKDDLARAFLGSSGSNADARNAEARLACVPSRLTSADAWKQWQDAKALVRVQQANLSALHKRIEVGRSLLSREKALISLAGVGEV